MKPIEPLFLLLLLVTFIRKTAIAPQHFAVPLKRTLTLESPNTFDSMVEAPSVPDHSVEAVANAALQITAPGAIPPVPRPLPAGWVLKESRSQPDYYYYYHQETGESSWHAPVTATALQPSEEPPRKRAASEEQEPEEPAPKKAKLPQKVRTLHILRKHKDSRRPNSWRAPKITITKEEAMEEMKGFQEILLETASDADELRATFEEIARTESDCSSAKRGGDLGFFGPKKMTPEFEKTSFALEIGELSDIIETNSGFHIILRIG